MEVVPLDDPIQRYTVLQSTMNGIGATAPCHLEQCTICRCVKNTAASQARALSAAVMAEHAMYTNSLQQHNKIYATHTYHCGSV